ncbi:hypothetical protein [Spongiimicrobium salis]|uniref:hypothetical protein n=1 Tax=Spongiimicrobium salis TaxID=1667022 RepID=UPI00374CF565
MKHFIFLIFTVLWSFNGMAQEDIPAKPLKIDAVKETKKESKGTALKIPSAFKVKKPVDLSRKKKGFTMLPEKKLVDAGQGLKIDARLGEKEKKNSKTHFGDQYLGDIKSSAKYIGVVCRDHEYVDGDRVRIYANGDVVESEILLTAGFKGINLDLKKGFNRIDFEALNQGSSGPNTAQVDVYDDKGQLIYSSKWNLSTGSKASLIVVKE